ncbi:MAG: iron-containing alcohol dehydrogenase family protein [Sporichthyaceae bacterium]|nr:iron-containing alcohol dehydrogenase family protein [Sporichthyaceae bacterium]
MPLLARMLLSPLIIDIRAGAVSGLGDLLADRRISADGRVAVAVGPGQGEQVVEEIRPALSNADVFTVRGGSLESAGELQAQLRGTHYDALVGIGGGRTLDVAKYAATRLALPMVAVATNLAHDGIASPVSSLVHDGGKGSFGVGLPLAVVVDLDFVRSSPARMVRSGVGDVVSNLSALADWWLAHEERGEPIDGLAETFARTAAEAMLHRTDGIDSDHFLTALADALVLSGMAMAAAGSSRPCSGSDHEILHAIDALFPGAGNHGELAGVGALFSFFLREDDEAGSLVDACLRRHGLPRLPADLGLSAEQFAHAVLLAPTTRPDRYTILEHLDLDGSAVQERVDAFVATYGN